MKTKFAKILGVVLSLALLSSLAGIPLSQGIAVYRSGELSFGSHE